MPSLAIPNNSFSFKATVKCIKKPKLWSTDKRFIFAWNNASDAKGEQPFKGIQITVAMLKLTQKIDEEN